MRLSLMFVLFLAAACFPEGRSRVSASSGGQAGDQGGQGGEGPGRGGEGEGEGEAGDEGGGGPGEGGVGEAADEGQGGEGEGGEGEGGEGGAQEGGGVEAGVGEEGLGEGGEGQGEGAEGGEGAGGEGGQGGVVEIGDRFVRSGGCDDVRMYAVTADQKMALTIYTEGTISRAREAGGELEELYDVPGGGMRLQLELGEELGSPLCNDVLTPGWRVDHTIDATAGRYVITVRPDEVGENARGDALLTGAEFIHPVTGERFTIERLEWVDVPVGWLAG